MEKRILRPMEYGDLLDEVFDLYKKNFMLFAGISAILYLPASTIFYSMGEEVAMFASVLLLPISFIAMAAVSWAVAKIYLGGTTDIVTSYKAILGRIISLICAMIIGYLAMSVGLVLLIIPGILVGIAVSLIPPVVVIENKGGVSAINRCWELSKGQRLRIFVVAIIAGVITAVIAMVLTMPIAILAGVGAEGTPMGGLMGALYGLANGVAQALASPIQIIAIVVLYYDIRVRKEAFDLELLAQSIGEAPPAEVPSQEGVKPF